MIKVIKEVSKEDLKNWIYEIDDLDSHLYEEANNPNKVGIFQISGSTAERLCEDVKPENFDELVAINAMARPGPLETAAPFFIKRKDGEPSPYPDVVNDVLEDTHYTMIYQEQIMKICQVVGGFSLEEANEVRGVMKKLAKAEKKAEDLKQWDRIMKKFLRNAPKNNIEEATAKKIADDMKAFAGYSFNRCFSGDCKIDRDNKARWSPTIEEMYLTKNDAKWARENGYVSLRKKYNRSGYKYAYSIKNERLHLNNIKDIYFEGNREVFQIKLEDGKKIEVTDNHKFPTPNGYKTIKKGLSIGDILFVKKMDYKLGRTKKNEKGLPIKKSKILSIRSIGYKNTYNVEMEAPYHTLSVNGIIASNSHATSYTYIALMTLYFSYYFRNYYYSAFLSYEDMKKINSVREQGIKILPPDINKSKAHFTPEGSDAIRFGLGDIKYVSNDKAIQILLENQPYKSVFDFLMRATGRVINIRLVNALISVGAFDNIYPDRKKLLTIIQSYWEKKKSTKVQEKLKKKFEEATKEIESMPGLETTIEDKIKYEKEFIGFKIFTTQFTNERLDNINKLKEKGMIKTSFKEVSKRPKKTPVVINKIRKINDKNNNAMAFINIEDKTGKDVSIPIFHSYYKHIGNELEEEKFYIMDLYKDDNNKIMFGTPEFEKNEHRIKRMVKKIGE